MRRSISICGWRGRKPMTLKMLKNSGAFSLLLLSILASGQENTDTTIKQLEGAVVRGTRQGSNPTNTTLNKVTLNELNLGQDLPILLQYTPNAVSYSDAGNGVGYTGIRIRGVDPSRINVTLNGVPVNDAESQGTYFVDVPDIGSSADNVQVQRGVGTSTNGTAAFGASINIQTDKSVSKAFAETNFAGGYIFPESAANYPKGKNRYSQKYNMRFGTGMIGQWSIEGRLSKILSDGYVDRSSSNLSSYFVQATRSGKKSMLKLIHFSGSEVTGQAWNGIPESRLNGDTAGMINYAMNDLLSPDELKQMRNSGNRTYNRFTYKNQTDNYRQDYYQVHHACQLNKQWLLNSTGFLTKGSGYYEEYKAGTDVAKYNLGIDTALHITNTDLIRRRWLDNYFYGVNANAIYTKGKLEALLGASTSYYDGKRWGEVIWARYAGASEINQHYYDGKSGKRDQNIFAKVSYQYNRNLRGYAELQARSISYHIKGNDESYNSIINYFLGWKSKFINPKAGLEYRLKNEQTLHLQYGRSGREPAYNDIMQATSRNYPKQEFLDDFEGGYRKISGRYSFDANLYFMNYKNQLVNDGTVNDVGVPLRVNVAKSYRAGIELSGSVVIHRKLQMTANLSLSQNKIKSFGEYATFYTDSTTYTDSLVKIYKNTSLSLSPSLVGSSILRYTPTKRITIDWLSKYVSKQYLDNTQNNSRSLKAFWVNDLRASADIPCKELRKVQLSFLLNNFLNLHYEPNGYTYGWFYNGSRVDNNFYFPQAGMNCFLQLTVGL